MHNKFPSFILSILFILCGINPTLTWSEDLIQVYHEAVVGDPIFRKANADWLTERQNLPLAITGNGVAGTGLLPNIDLDAQINRNYDRNIEGGTVLNDSYFTGNQWGLTVVQPIFNYATWKAISSAKYSVKSATATYFAAEQDLMFRTTQAYFNVLKAYDNLQYVAAEKKYLAQQLTTQRQKFKVGLIAVTDVYNAQASYNSAVAREIANEHNVRIELENLRAITGIHYSALKALKKVIPLVIPKPRSINVWVETANRQNYTIQAALFAMFSAREDIKLARAGNYPTLTAQATYTEVTQGAGAAGFIGNGVVGGTGVIKADDAQVNLDLNFPVFRGGYDIQNTKQAQYQFLSASDQLEFNHRDVTRLARQAYLSVESGIAQIKADEKLIFSSQKQLEATEAGYQVGTRTYVDVLSSISDLYNSLKVWSADRYDYIVNIVSLKEQAGTLNPCDLQELNHWLAKYVYFENIGRSFSQENEVTHSTKKVLTFY